MDEMNSRKRGEKTMLTFHAGLSCNCLAFMHLEHTRRHGGKNIKKKWLENKFLKTEFFKKKVASIFAGQFPLNHVDKT